MAKPKLKQKSFKSQFPKPTINDFDLHEVIGFGGYAQVMRAFNRKSKRMVALKVLPKHKIVEMKHTDHVINEREVLNYLMAH